MTLDVFDEKDKENERKRTQARWVTRISSRSDTCPTKTYSSTLVINNICIYGVLMSNENNRSSENGRQRVLANAREPVRVGDGEWQRNRVTELLLPVYLDRASTKEMRERRCRLRYRSLASCFALRPAGLRSRASQYEGVIYRRDAWSARLASRDWSRDLICISRLTIS